MGRKPIISGGKKDEIIAVARKMFFEKGFDGVTIRTLQREVGCEVGLFYYYFKSKEEVFDVVVEQMESEWKEIFDDVMVSNEENPRICLDKLFEAVGIIGSRLRAEGSDSLHWSVIGGIYDRIIKVAENYVERILDDMGVRGFSVKEQAIIVAGGLGRLALTQTGNGYKERIDYVLSAAGIQDYSYNRRREISVELL